MTTDNCIIIIIIICITFLIISFGWSKYRLLMPSTMNFLTWGLTSFLLYSSTMGSMSNGLKTLSDYKNVAPFLLGMMISSLIGFTLARFVSSNQRAFVYSFPEYYIDRLLKKFKWVLYVCFITGSINMIFMLTTFGFDNLGDYRIAALMTKRTGIIGYVQLISGHASLICLFYIAMFGYKQSISGINVKQFIVYILMFGMNNIANAGRGWITMAMVPYLIGYFYGMRSMGKVKFSEIIDKNFKKIIVIGVLLFAFFSVFGAIRNDGDVSSGESKFLYYTDGTGVTDIVMRYFPDGSFPLEYGACEFLNKWIPSPMESNFSNAISDDIGLSVTVPSTMPSLYFDFGYNGGIIMWGVFCFIFELTALNLIARNTILSFFLYVQLTRMLFQAPIGPIFSMAMNIFEWLLIMYIFRKKLFE